MCWSGEASLTLAAAGMATTAYVAWKKESPLLYLPLGYFSLMELLQGYTYTVIDQCGLPSNQIATLLGYLHIAFQPFFANMIALYFIPEDVRKRVQTWAYSIAGFSAIFMLIQLFPFDWTGACRLGRPLCGTELCSVSGNWHIAWLVPVNDIGESNIWPLTNGFWTYMLAVFWIPMIYGSWRLNLFHYTFGPFLASLTTDNPNEVPAVWCLLSIAILMVVVKSPLRKHMHVKSYPLWPLLMMGKKRRSPPPDAEPEPAE